MNNKKTTISHADLAHFTGSVCHYRYSPQLFPNFLLTEGCRYLAENACCYWLFDTLASVQKLPEIKALDIQFWTLNVANASGILTCVADSGESPVFTESLDYTDFPLDQIKIWVAPSGGNNLLNGKPDLVAMLPSEY